MYYEKYGDPSNPIIVFLHGANFVSAFGRQYELADNFYLLVPHIMGYGNEAHRTFDVEAATQELAQFIQGLGRKVNLVGFSLGAQLAVKLIAEHPNLFEKAVIVSPWLIKQEPELSHVQAMNLKQLNTMKKPFFCNLIGLMNGMPKPQRKEFVQQMQQVSEETQTNMVHNGITLDTVPGFKDASFPILVLAGAKEQQSMLDSVQALAEMNPHCTTEVWERAAHNIPPVFYRQFNERLRAFFSDK